MVFSIGAKYPAPSSFHLPHLSLFRQSSLSSSLLPSVSLAGGALLLNVISEAITEHGLGE